MRTLAVILVLAAAAMAQQCEVLEMTTASSLDSGLVGGIHTYTHSVYTVRFNDSVYQVVPQRQWFPRLAVGAHLDCRLKKNDIIMRDGYHYAIVGEAPVQRESR